VRNNERFNLNHEQHKIKSFIRETLNIHDKELSDLINDFIHKSKKSKKLISLHESAKSNHLNH